jgi:hypothetical protein
VAVIVRVWIPRRSAGSGTSTVANAVVTSGPLSNARPADRTRIVTADAGVTALPYVRTAIVGRSDARYSGAIEASTKNGRPTGTATEPTPAWSRRVTAEAVTRHEVRSSERRKEVLPRPSAPVVIVSNRSASLKSSRSPPPPPVSPPSPWARGLR